MRTRTRVVGLLSLAVVFAALAGCLPGGCGWFEQGVTGWWTLTDLGTGDQEGVIYFRESGTTVSEAGDTLTLTGDQLTGTVHWAPSMYMAVGDSATLSCTVSQDTISGTCVVNGATTYDIRMDSRSAPSGSFTASGTCEGQPVDVSTSTPYGTAWYFGSDLDEVDVVQQDGDSRFLIALIPWGSLVDVGTFDASSDILVLAVMQEGAVWYVDMAVSGTITITRCDTSGIEGSYSVNLSLGGSMSGSFDVSWEHEYLF